MSNERDNYNKNKALRACVSPALAVARSPSSIVFEYTPKSDFVGESVGNIFGFDNVQSLSPFDSEENIRQQDCGHDEPESDLVGYSKVIISIGGCAISVCGEGGTGHFVGTSFVDSLSDQQENDTQIGHVDENGFESDDKDPRVKNLSPA